MSDLQPASVACNVRATPSDPFWEAVWTLDEARRLIDGGDPEQAETLCRELLRRQPRHPDALHLLGLLLLRRGHGDLAISLMHRAIEVNPSVARYHTDLAHALRAQGSTEDALASYQAADRLAPDAGLRVNMATLLPLIPQSRDEIEHWRSRLKTEIERLAADPAFQLDDPVTQVGTTAFNLAYHGLSDLELQAAIARFYLSTCPALDWTAPHCRPGTDRRHADRRVRLGVASAYFRHHTITKVTKGLIDRLNRDRFHVTVFHLGPEDAWTDAVRASADRAIRLTGSLAEMRATIADEALDVLFYPDIGMHAATYFLAFARLAPVQCVSWGHPETTGIPNVDDYLSSADLEPDGSESEYAERLVRFQRLPTYFYRPDVTGITSDRERFGLPDGYRLYVCPQLMFKLHPDFDRVMADILRRDPQGMLVFLEGAKGAASHRWTLFRDRFMRAHSDVANRVLVRPFLDHNDFMTLIATADVLLDPIYFGGGNTSLEALAIGTPIVTWPGPFARGRTTYACFRRMGVLDSVVASLDEYAERAVGLAMDHAWNADVRARIQQRNHRLYEDETVIEEFETYFETVAANARLRDRHVRKDPAR